jgi:hypothetical protein
MKPTRFAWAIFAGVLAATSLAQADEWLERLDDALAMSAFDHRLRARLSGTLDLEGFAFSRPAPAFIDATGTSLFNPRLTTFLDVQFGEQLYAFVQARADRGFDPGNEAMTARFDEYAIRYTPWSDGRLNVQVGKFASVIGSWILRHGSWEDAFVTAPLAYENLTGIWDIAAAPSANVLLGWAHVQPRQEDDEDQEKYFRLPAIWGPSYATGAAVSGRIGHIEYALEVKNASLSSRPNQWTAGARDWSDPTVSGRIGYRPNAMLNFGLSASTGGYLREEARPTIPSGFSIHDYRETIIGQDFEFAWHHLQIWSEVFAARFEIPRVGNVATYVGYVEAKYKFTPQLFGALRLNRQTFDEVTDSAGRRRPWGRNLSRLDVGPGYRFTPYSQLKLQYSLSFDAVDRRYRSLVAAQFVFRF